MVGTSQSTAMASGSALLEPQYYNGEVDIQGGDGPDGMITPLNRWYILVQKSTAADGRR